MVITPPMHGVRKVIVLKSLPAYPCGCFEKKLLEVGRRVVAGMATEEVWTKWSPDIVLPHWEIRRLAP